MTKLLLSTDSNTTISWFVYSLCILITGWSMYQGILSWTLLGFGVIISIPFSAVRFQSLKMIIPWPISLLAVISLASGVLLPLPVINQFAVYATVATISLAIAIQLELFTSVRMTRGFAVAFVVLTTMTAAGTWELSQWLLDLVLGTELVESNDAVMRRLISATIVGVLAGILFDRYLRDLVQDDFIPDGFELEDADTQVAATSDAVEQILSKLGISESQQKLLIRSIQGLLAVICIIGILTLNIDIVVNASIGLVATFIPAMLERDFNFELHPGLTLWIAIAVILHALGTLVFYQTVWGWHNLAHAVSGTLVAAVGYTLIRAIETHTTSISFPPHFTFLFVILFVFSAGVLWEILEFTLDTFSAALGTEGMLLAQHGLEDTMSDLLANTVGALFVASIATLLRLR